ncbi:MAG: succinate dehydrogenase/fumarate reductase iron-sulfur subunit [Salinirussus sp.]
MSTDTNDATTSEEAEITSTADTADMAAETTEYTLRVFRGDDDEGEFVEYDVPVQEGMVVLDCIHWIQANEAPDLAVRWNCKSGRCGSCSVEINGLPKLACMTRMADYDPDEPVTVTPMTTFPVIKDLVPDVSWNYEVNEEIEPFSPDQDADFEYYQEDVERAREFRKCIECFLCQDVCHVLREHDKKEEFAGPRFFVRSAGLHFHPEDTADRTDWLADASGDGGGVGYCNITRCCSNICPENIEITDNAIIPQKEAVVDERFDPLRMIGRKLGLL